MHPTATMAEEKGKIGTCEYVESARPSKESGTVKTKHVFVAVTCIVVVVVLVAGIIGAAYVFKSAAKDIVKFHLKAKDKDGEQIDEDVETDKTNDVVTYHLITPMGEHWVLNDFSKDITLHKIKTNGNTACFVTPLNQSEADPETVRANMKDNGIRNTESAIFQVTEAAIKKPAFLGKTINNMCSGVSIYWLSPKCGGNSTDLAERPESEDNVNTRNKRSRLACVECGCYRLYAPWVKCTRRVFWGTAYYTLYYRGRPVRLYRVSSRCNSGLRTSMFGQIRQDRRGNIRSSHNSRNMTCDNSRINLVGLEGVDWVEGVDGVGGVGGEVGVDGVDGEGGEGGVDGMDVVSGWNGRAEWTGWKVWAGWKVWTVWRGGFGHVGRGGRCGRCGRSRRGGQGGRGGRSGRFGRCGGVDGEGGVDGVDDLDGVDGVEGVDGVGGVDGEG
ncbi:hypothetical protein LSAT2_032702 [Lamellibrachia satsuma]|nr:hypothetical protein LSAT2_032702 [Lamellibrachia satsuma]